jgi:hypothetical protein
LALKFLRDFLVHYSFHVPSDAPAAFWPQTELQIISMSVETASVVRGMVAKMFKTMLANRLTKREVHAKA